MKNKYQLLVQFIDEQLELTRTQLNHQNINYCLLWAVLADIKLKIIELNKYIERDEMSDEAAAANLINKIEDKREIIINGTVAYNSLEPFLVACECMNNLKKKINIIENVVGK